MWIDILKKCCSASKPVLSLLGSGALLSGCGFAHAADNSPHDSAKPNIVLIYSDDVGYGDLSCYGQDRMQTPNIDLLAKGGLLFTQAYATAATCTPSRYSILTGEYAFRKQGTNILNGQANLIISPKRKTLPAIMRSAGYTTAALGKWHVGLGEGKIDWNREIRPGPSDVGFDYSFILPATPDRVPCVYLENGRVVNDDPNDPIAVSYDEPLPDILTAKTNPEMLRMKPMPGHEGVIVDGVSRIGYMKGGKRALWKDEEMADTFVSKAKDFITRSRGRPFFLYYASNEIHAPRMPNPRFVGKTGLGPRGDSLLELDWCVGEIVKCLRDLKLEQNTLIIFSSDNGPVLRDGYEDMARELYRGENPTGGLRGGKYSIFDGGMRIPMIVSFPGRVKPGMSDAMISQVDFTASLAALVGQKTNPDDSPDSLNLIDVLLGKSDKGRDSVVVQGASIAYIEGPWKYIAPTTGWVSYDENTGIETGIDANNQLYKSLVTDREKTNLAAQFPQKTNEMKQKLTEVTKKTSKY